MSLMLLAFCLVDFSGPLCLTSRISSLSICPWMSENKTPLGLGTLMKNDEHGSKMRSSIPFLALHFFVRKHPGAWMSSILEIKNPYVVTALVK